MVPLYKTPRAQRGNVVFSAYESGLEAPVSLLVFHLNCFYYITLNCCGDRQLFGLRCVCFPYSFLYSHMFLIMGRCSIQVQNHLNTHMLSTTVLPVSMSHC